MKPLIVIALLLLSITANADTYFGKVVKIADGDTVTILNDQYQQLKVRLAGIDAPERSQAFGKKSKQHLSRLIGGKRIRVETNKTDHYGRLVGVIFYNHRDINLAMVEAGLAWHYKKYQREQSRADRQRYSAAEKAARLNRIGLFADNRAMAPWDWRNNKANQQPLKQSKKQLSAPQQLLSTMPVNDVTVWVNLKSSVYHCPNTRYYQNTKRGKLYSQSQALQQGFRPAHDRKCY